MNKRVFKCITFAIPVVLGCITTCSIISSNKTTSSVVPSPETKTFEFNDINSFLNFAENFNYDIGIDPNKDYTVNGDTTYTWEDEKSPEYVEYVSNGFIKNDYRFWNLLLLSEYGWIEQSVCRQLYIWYSSSTPDQIKDKILSKTIYSFSATFTVSSDFNWQTIEIDGVERNAMYFNFNVEYNIDFLSDSVRKKIIEREQSQNDEPFYIKSIGDEEYERTNPLSFNLYRANSDSDKLPFKYYSYRVNGQDTPSEINQDEESFKMTTAYLPETKVLFSDNSKFLNCVTC